MPKKPRLLLLAPQVPGGKGERENERHCLAHLAESFRVHLFCLAREGEGIEREPDLAKWTKRVKLLPYRPSAATGHWRSLLDPLPRFVRHWQNIKVLSNIGSFSRGRDYQVVLLHGLRLWPYARKLFSRHQPLAVWRPDIEWERPKADHQPPPVSKNEQRKIVLLEKQVYRRSRAEFVDDPEHFASLESLIGDRSKLKLLGEDAPNLGAAILHALDSPPLSLIE